MAPYRLISVLLLALSASAVALTAFPLTAGGGGGRGGEAGPAMSQVKGAPVGQTSSEAQAAAAAGQVAAQSPDGSEDDRKRKQLEIYRLSAEIAQLAAEFGQ